MGPSDATVSVGGAQLAYDDQGVRTGGGKAVVLLHPGVGDKRCWSATTGALVDRYRVIAYDRRGFGATRYDPEDHDPADDLVALLDALEVDRVALVGSSMGGAVAIEFTLAHPERVWALVLVGSAVAGAPAPEGQENDDVEALFDRLDELEAAGDLEAVNELEARIWLDGPSRPHGAVGGEARALFLAMNGQALAADPPEERPPAVPGWDRLGEITAPVLVLVGRHDLPHVVERSGMLAARVGHGRFDELPDSAHLPQLDDPERFNDVVRRFLDEH